ncbi:DNA repair exonuclease SbcCD ATPase subunit [Flavobacterium gillisiae]|uniref:DNA repair exonuclease SbcCD ATPase subunit n=1 Tax=Flavobacterium gillisiae TaxID=150146 RepID=A0A1H4GAB2_9FLAO|nr:AAA family ATPase [Flavobacterium gillisiae]SEB06367.1 DNA repair exonuclease SbcCD ATPase subunit [Flavobacterium gillisiae]
MNTQQLIEQSQKLFTDFKPVNNELYKGQLNINNKASGIYYLNFNQEISEDVFEELQDKYLAEEFYNQTEVLQWNIYLLFINSNISEDLKLKILRNDKYARKLIFNGNEFLDYFKLEESSSSELPDIISVWKEELNKVGLQELHSSASNDGIVRNFLNDKSPAIVNRAEKNLEHIPIIEKINSINLNQDFRRFPQIRNFNFGSVNLFTGSNGVGKTSLLESIELVLTGKTQRNKDKYEAPNSITAVLNQDFVDTYSHNNRIYKERGTKWYKRRLTEQGNRTYESFNQFNFFNTDAAHQFSNAEDAGAINESLKQIILGEEFTILKDKIEKIRPRLRTELNKASKEISQKLDNLKKNKDRISELKNDENFNELKGNIKGNMLSLRYKAIYDESNYSVSGLFVNEIKNELDFILSKKVTNFSKFKEVSGIVETRKNLVSENKEAFNLNIVKSNESILDRQKNKDILSKINTFYKYIEIDNCSKIEDLAIKYKKIETQLLTIKTLKDLNNLQLDIVKLSEERKSLADLISSKKSVLVDKTISQGDLKGEISLLQKGFSLNEGLIIELKTIGIKILNDKFHSNQCCPLCDQEISKTELLLRLDNDFKNDDFKNLIKSKNDLLEVLNKEIDQLELELKHLRRYEMVVFEYLKDYEGLNLSQINNAIKERIAKENEILSEKELYDKIFFQLNNIEGSISEFSILKLAVQIIYPNVDILRKQVLTEIIDNLKMQINKSSTEVDNFKVSNDKIINDLNVALKLSSYADSFDKIEEIIKSNDNLIDSLNFSFQNLNRYLDIPTDKSIIDLSKDLALLNKNLDTFRLIENSQNEIKKLLTSNEEIEKSFPNLKTLNGRLNRAVEVLDKLSDNSEDIILEDFFKANLIEIKDIFTTIHSPKEFDNIAYVSSKLVLIKGGESYEISQISTGQRAALVLSIFISLNRKLENGPNILIFDDPVTFIDDFNALSFLDFLRYFIVKEKKQIFFATANKKFSSLFKKKFEFLGDEFKEFKLER